MLNNIFISILVTAAATNEESVGTAFVRMNLGFLFIIQIKKYLNFLKCLELDAANTTDSGAKGQNVCIEMTARDFFMFLHQTENIKNVLSSIQNN